MEHETQLTIRIPNAMAFGSKVAGEWLPVDLSKVDNSYLVELLRYGAQRKVNDNAKGESPQERLAIARLVVADMNEGKVLPLRSVRGSQVDPVQGKARQLSQRAIKEYLQSKGLDVKAHYTGKTASEKVEVQDKWIVANPELLEVAKDVLKREVEAQVAAKAAMESKGDDLASIFA